MSTLFNLHLSLASLFRRVFSKRFLKFGTVGASGTVVNLGVLYWGQEHLFRDMQPIQLKLNVSLALAIFLATVNNFFWNRLWTWVDRKQLHHKSWLVQFWQYTLACGLSIALQILFTNLLAPHFFYQVANLIVAQLLYLNHEDPEREIQMYINCPGGQIYAGLAIYDTMQMLSNPISTVAVGMTASFGTVLLTAGTKGRRYALPNATIHLHQPLGGAQGQATDIEIAAKQIIRLKGLLNQMMSNHTGQPLEVIERDTDRDFYMTAPQAVEYGLVDQVLASPPPPE
jgi:ATP-dependent Clp protease protease subunit